MNLVYVTGNEHKARYFSEILGLDIGHESADIDELQTLDLKEVVTHKARAAYERLERPVIVEDTSLIIEAMGRLPGTFIKWFLEEMGVDKICRLADIDADRRAYAAAYFAYYDGKEMVVFEGGVEGRIAQNPAGESGFGWNRIFIPSGSEQTLGEMNDEDFKDIYTRIKPFPALKDYLTSLPA